MNEPTGTPKVDRRHFMAAALAGSAAIVAGSLTKTSEATKPIIDKKEQPVAFMPLPYAPMALAPYISENTINFHYGKHHRSYLEKTNALLKGTKLEELSLEEIVRKSYAKPETAALFNNAAQTFNHNFFWQSLRPMGGGTPSGDIASAIDANFDSHKNFVEK